jgi:hypothetical protein
MAAAAVARSRARSYVAPARASDCPERASGALWGILAGSDGELSASLPGIEAGRPASEAIVDGAAKVRADELDPEKVHLPELGASDTHAAQVGTL